MKIASFNINNIRKRLPNLLDWLREAGPDVVCLQELKTTDAEFPAEAIRQAGYAAVWRGQKNWNGVAILSRWAPVLTCGALPGDPSDTQSRYIEAAVNGVIIASIYTPNGNPQPGPKFMYKLAWLKRLTVHTAELYATGVPVVLAGDYNVVPTDLDIYPTKSWDKDALLQPESRAAYANLLMQGWLDAIRTLHPKEPMYTYWDYMRKRWERDGGLRLDHMLLSPSIAKRLKGAASTVWCVGKRTPATMLRSGWSCAMPPRTGEVRFKSRRAQLQMSRWARARKRSQPSRRRKLPRTLSGDREKHPSPNLSSATGPCWSLTATLSRTAPITPCPKPFSARMAKVAAPSSVSRISCSGFIKRSSLAPLSWGGTRWRCRPNGTNSFQRIKAGVNLTMP